MSFQDIFSFFSFLLCKMTMHPAVFQRVGRIIIIMAFSKCLCTLELRRYPDGRKSIITINTATWGFRSGRKGAKMFLHVWATRAPETSSRKPGQRTTSPLQVCANASNETHLTFLLAQSTYRRRPHPKHGAHDARGCREMGAVPRAASAAASTKSTAGWSGPRQIHALRRGGGPGRHRGPQR